MQTSTRRRPSLALLGAFAALLVAVGGGRASKERTNVALEKTGRLRIIRAVKTLLCVSAIAALMTAGARGGSSDGPPAFHLVFDGKHNASLLHEGPFTTSSAFCPSGYATDVEVNDLTLTAIRKFTCSASGVNFTARVASLRAEHGGSGTWQIVGGSGPLSDLRGKGTYTSVRLSGSSDDPASITFESTWDGVADVDADPPTIAVLRATARKLKHPAGTYQLRAVLSLVDASNSVSYTLLAVDPRRSFDPLASRTGLTGKGTVTLVLSVRPTKRTHAIRLRIDTSDPFGNASSLIKTVLLPRR